MSEESTTEPMETPPPPIEEAPRWQRIAKRLVPLLVGFLAFVFGLLFFAPLEDYALLALRQASATGPAVEIGNLKLSSFGNFKAESLKIPLSGEGENQGLLKIAEVKGDISLFSILFSDTYKSTANAVILSFSQGNFGLKIDSLEAKTDLTQKKSGGTQQAFQGSVSFEGESAQVVYKEMRFLKEEIVVPFLKVILKLRVHESTIAIDECEALGRLASVKIKGSMQTGAQGQLSLNVVLKPTDEFYEKYQDKDPRTLLRFANVLQDDGRIELNIRGTLSQPQVQPVTVQPTATTTPPHSDER